MRKSARRKPKRKPNRFWRSTRPLFYSLIKVLLSTTGRPSLRRPNEHTFARVVRPKLSEYFKFSRLSNFNFPLDNPIIICIQYTNIRSWTNTRSKFDLKCQIFRELRPAMGAAFGCTGAALGSCKRSCDYAPRRELQFEGTAPRKFDKKFQVLIKNF